MRFFRKGTSIVNDSTTKGQGDGAGVNAGAGAGAGAGGSDKITHHRVRILHGDGSRSWHVEEAADEDSALRLARGRSMGEVLYAEPLNADGSPRGQR